MTTGRLAAIAVLAATVLLAGCTGPAPDAPAAPGPGTPVEITGDVHGSFEIPTYGLAKSPGFTTVDVQWWGGPGVGTRFERHRESGVDLMRFNPFDRYDAGVAGTPVQSAVLLAVGADGATAALSYTEVVTRPAEDSVSSGGVLLSYSEDGRDLAQPRLIVLGDRTGDRAIRDVVELRVVRLDG